MLNPLDLFRCVCAMSGMFPRLILTRKVDAIFVWGRATDEWQATRYDDGLLALAADVHRLTGAPVVIPGYAGSERGQGERGYPGPKRWYDALSLLGVGVAEVLTTKGVGINTKTEMEDFLDETSSRTVVAVTSQLHALRAMLGTVKSLQTRQRKDVIVVPVWPHRYDWSRESCGSQGEGPYNRPHWIDQEFNRILRYQAQGDLATLDELFVYFSGVHTELSRLTSQDL